MAVEPQDPHYCQGNMDELGPLPMLFDEDLNAFEFDQTFTGDTDGALDRFFADVFCLPSFPRPRRPDSPSLPVDASWRSWSAFRDYRSDDDVLKAYYRLIHPAFPILPPPAAARNTPSVGHSCDGIYEPSSPLILALLSLLVPITASQSPDGLAPDATPHISLAYSFAQCAAEACDVSSNIFANNPPSSITSPTHPHVPVELEVPLAFCLLSLYQYLHHGNITDMTMFAKKAYDSAIRLSLHKGCEESSTVNAEAKRRAWWMTYLCVCHASIVSCKPPVPAINVKDIPTPYPTSKYSPWVWERYIRAEETLVASTLLLVSLVKGVRSDAVIPSFRQSLGMLDNLIKTQLTQLANSTPVVLTCDGSPESRLANRLHNITRMRLMSANIKTHRYRALMEYPAILEKFKAFPPLDISERPPSECNTSQSTGVGKVHQIFPFSSLDSLQNCCDSALGISACLDSLKGDLLVAPFICSAIIAGYTAMMILYFHSSAKCQPSALLAVNGLRRQCKSIVTSTVHFLDRYSAGSPYLCTLTYDLRRAAAACGVNIDVQEPQTSPLSGNVTT